MLFSLLVGTVQRPVELGGLLASLDAQTCGDFEALVVDQGSGSDAKTVCDRFAERLSVRHVPCPVRGLSHARNLALKLAKGPVLAFPDDDSAYPPGLLEGVRGLMEARRDVDILSVDQRYDRSVLDAPATAGSPGRLRAVNFLNFRRLTTSATLFVRRGVLDRIGTFDERLGVGTPLGSAEDTDFTIRALRSGIRIAHCSDLCVYHPAEPGRYAYNARSAERARRYGYGIGFVVRRHLVQGRDLRLLPYGLRSCLGPVAGIFLGVATLNGAKVRHHAASLRSRLLGLLGRVGG